LRGESLPPAVIAEALRQAREEDAHLLDLPLQRGAALALLDGDLELGTDLLPSFLPTALRQTPKRDVIDYLLAYSTVPPLRVCTDILADKLGSNPWESFKGKTPTGKRMARQLIAFNARTRDERLERKKVIKGLRKSGDLVELADDDPYLDFQRSGILPYLTGIQIERIGYACKFLVGESFTVMERDVLDRPLARLPIPPNLVFDIAKPFKPVFTVRGFYDGLLRDVPQQDMLFRKVPDMLNPYARGSGVGQAVSRELETDRAMSESDLAFFYNGARPDLLVIGAAQTPKDARRQEIAWNHALRGPNRAHRTRFINPPEGRSAKDIVIQDLSRSAKDLQFSAKRTQLWEFARIVMGKIPPEVMGITGNSNRATIDAAWYVLGLTTLIPELELEQEIRNIIVIPQFAIDGITRVTQYVSPIDEDHDYYLAVAEAFSWSRTVDEQRDMQDLPELPNGRGQIFAKPPGVTFTDILFDPDAPPPAASPFGAPSAKPAQEDPDPQDKTKPEDKEPQQAKEPAIPPAKPAAKSAAPPVIVRAATGNADADAIEELADQLAPALRGLFLHAIATAQDRVDLSALRATLAAGHYEQAIRLLPLDELGKAMGQAEVPLRAVLTEAGQKASAALGAHIDDDFSFDPADEAVGAWAAARGADLSGWIQGSAADMAQGVIDNDLKPGLLNADQAARAIKDRLGLAPADSTAVSNRREELLAGGADAELAAEGADSYAGEKFAARADGFGMGQAFGAAQEGQRRAWIQAADVRGTAATAERAWGTQRDGDVCPVCKGLDGERATLDEPFISNPAKGGDGKPYLMPGDPHDDGGKTCRCYAVVLSI
jgi:hypothetical protein